MLNCHSICINENERANFVHSFINHNMKVYRLSADYDQKKEKFPEDIVFFFCVFFCLFFFFVFFINKGRMPNVTQYFCK